MVLGRMFVRFKKNYEQRGINSIRSSSVLDELIGLWVGGASQQHVTLNEVALIA